MKAFARATTMALLWALSFDQASAQRSDTTIIRVGAPVHAGMGTLSEEFTLGQGSAATEYKFTMPYVFSGPSGGVFVVDVSNPTAGWTNTTVRLYDSTGKFVRTYGRSGQGPGEISGAVSDVKHLQDGRVLLATRRGVLVYAANGAGLPGLEATGTYLFVDPAGFVLVSGAIDRGVQFSSLHRFGFDGKWVDSPTHPAAAFPTRPMLSGNNLVRGETGPLPFASRHLVKWSPRGYFVTSNTANYAVDLRMPQSSNRASTSGVLWKDGDPVISIRRDVPPVPLSAAERADWRQSITMFWQRQNPNWAWFGPELPSVKSAIAEMQVAADGRIWVRVSVPSILNPTVVIRDSVSREPWVDVEAERRWVEPWVYDLFEPSGQYVGQVQFPETRTPAFAWRFESAVQGDTAWGVVYDKDDVASVKRYRIKWAGE